MNTLVALALATPIFGFSLTPPVVDPVIDLALPGSVAMLDDADMELDGELDAELDADAADGEISDGDADAQAGDEDDYESQLARRNDLIKWHKPLGLATWGAMTVTTVLGLIQYYNLYGFFADQGSNPCVEGDAIFGQGQCTGTPLPHAIGAALTTGLYGATFTISLMMPDPDDLASTKGEFGDNLRLHKFLRWVHFGGMVAQAIIGVVIANDLGLDRANDYDTLQTLATVHMATGLVTLGALTWAGTIYAF
jgi:hypothetical protein